MEVRREIGAPFDAARRVQMDGADPRLARLTHLATNKTGDLGEVIVGAGNHAAVRALVRQERRYHVVELAKLRWIEEKLAVAVLGVSVQAEVDPAPQLARAAYDREQLVEIVAPDHGIEANAIDPPPAHALDDIEDPGSEIGDAAGDVMATVEIVQRDIELIDAGAPERERSLDGEHP